MNIYFFQCQEDYNGNMYLPYSSGILWAYVSQFEEIRQNYNLVDIYFEKIDPNLYLEKLKLVKPDIALFSNYGWNTLYHLSIAKLIKEHYPDCKIIIGGPNAQQQKEYLLEHSYVDISVWGEGEQTLLELFRSFITDNDISNIHGLAYIKDNQYILTPIRDRFKEINHIPSPYLSGVFDSFYNRYNYNFMPVWETNRGCPYSCTFCDLGAEYYSKVHQFSDERLLSEIDYFSDKNTEYIEIADANFGIVKRDLDLVKRIREKYTETGFPQKINATWAKSSPGRIFEMAKILDSMNRGGVTLALQSSNKTALSNIKRVNIANDKLAVISKKYAENNMQTYHDFIVGLPGETLDSWKEGLLYVLDINPEGWIFGHPLEAYKNTEFADVNYIKQHDLKFAVTPQVSFFAQRRKHVPIEYGNYVISTNTLSKEDYIECFLFKWFLISNHSLGWTNYIGKNSGIALSEFYPKLYEWMKTNDCLMYEQYVATKEKLEHTLNTGDFWGRQMFGDDDIYWEYESASCIVYEQNRKRYFSDIERFIKEVLPNTDLNIISENDKQLICHSRDKNEWSFRDFCINIYWYGRRKKAWKL
jgi:radical SAM superfamily enzyme YgiQ (UPF0313 family)